MTGAGGIPEGTVSDVPCHHAYKLLSTLASTQLSWVNCQLGLSVAQGEPVCFVPADDFPLAELAPLAVRGTFVVGMIEYAQSVTVLLFGWSMSASARLLR